MARGTFARRPTLPKPVATWSIAPYVGAFVTVIVGCGWIASQPTSPKLVAVLVGVSLLGWLLAKRPGIAVGLLVLGTQNGLPFVDTAATYFHGIAVDNYIGFALIAVLGGRAVVKGRRGLPNGRTGFAGLIGGLGLCLAAWWLVTLVRSGGEPVSVALSFGRNFIVFALLAPLFAVSVRTRRDQVDILTTVCVGALLYAVGEVAATVGHSHLSWLVHPIAVRTSDVGLRRVYAFMSDATILLFCLGIGAALLATVQRTRRVGVAMTLLSSVAIILQQTRAIYLSLPLALLIVGAGALCVPAARARVTWRATAAIATVAVLVPALTVAVPHAVSVYGAEPLSRLNSVPMELLANQGNVGYRLNVAHELLARLGGSPVKWLTGLGFLDPAYHFFNGLPKGSIRNSDLGLVDGIMLVGVIGVVTVYLIAIVPLWRLIAAARTWREVLPDESWAVFGMALWLTQVLLASYTLTTLWQEQGEVLTAMVAGIAVNAAARSARHAPARGQVRLDGSRSRVGAWA